MLQKKYFIYGFLIIWVLISGGGAALWAATAEEQFYKAEVSYKKFLKDKQQVKYRDNWLACIRKFETAYKKSPSGPLAAASLYMAGKLYGELYGHSGKSSDREEAVDTFRRIVRRFPDSHYRVKAESDLNRLSGGSKKTDSHPKKTPRLTKKSSVEKTVYKPQPSARIRTKTRGKAFKRSKAAYKVSLKKRKKASVSAPAVSKTEEPFSDNGQVSGDATLVSGLRVWSNPSYTRIVVDADQDTRYTHEFLEGKGNAPHRLYIDFTNSRLGKNMNKIIPINDDLLSGARAGQHTRDSVRVVVDIKSFKTYKIFSLKNPFRTVIDVWGMEAGHTYAKSRQSLSPRPRSTPRPAPSVVQASVQDDPSVTPHDLAKQLALGVRRIVIDPGHGGHDGGAPGYVKGVKEKDIVLKIAKRLARKIRKELGCDVIMTRKTDRFLSLEERTAIANTKNADLFISIHCNADKRRRGYGIETYFLNLATDDDAIRVAARENATSRKNISDLQAILNDLMKNAKINESSRLAGHVQREMFRYMKRRYNKVKNKGVKQAPFYVLLGAQMPSILIETSFISHKRECQRLMNSSYQEHLCNAIVRGIGRYIRETNPTAFLKTRSPSKG